MIKNIIMSLFLIIVLVVPAYSYNIEYKNVIFDSKDIQKLSKSDSTLFIRVMDEYTEYGIELISGIIIFYGTPYKYGGTTKNGIDCSAFTQNVFQKVEFNLPRTAREQALIGEFISRDSLQLGDLLFFSKGGYISHVGIYIGHGQFVHASTKNRKVCVQELNTAYYDNFFAFAKRVNT